MRLVATSLADYTVTWSHAPLASVMMRLNCQQASPDDVATSGAIPSMTDSVHVHGAYGSVVMWPSRVRRHSPESRDLLRLEVCRVTHGLNHRVTPPRIQAPVQGLLGMPVRQARYGGRG